MAIAGILSACTGTPTAPLKPISFLVSVEGRPVFDQVISSFQMTTGYNVQLEYTPFAQIGADILSLLDGSGPGGKAQAGLKSAWSYDVASVADLDAAGAFLDLAAYVRDDTSLHWLDVLPYFRDFLATYQGRIVGLPQAVLLPNFYYRRDWAEQHNITLPATWEELLDSARRINNTDLDGDGVAEWALCMPLIEPAALQQAIFSSILASITQYTGQAQGFLVDPLTMEPLINTPAGMRAMELYTQIFQYTLPEPTSAVNSTLLYGRCMYALRLSEPFKLSLFINNGSTSGKLGSLMYPGSEQVYDRIKHALVLCADAPTLCSDVVTRGNVTLRFNRAPFSGSAFSAAVNPNADPAYFKATYQLMAATIAPAVVDQFRVLNKQSPVGPLRRQHLELAPWLALGYDASDTTEFLDTVRATLGHHNTIVDLRIIGAAKYKQAIEQACLLATVGGRSIPSVVEELDKTLRALLPTDPLSRAHVQENYWAAIGYKGPAASPAPPPTLASSDAHNAHDTLVRILAPSVVVPVGCALLALLAGCAVVALRGRSGHRGLWGRATAPTGPEASLVMTDVQGSTMLWDVLDTATMEAVLALHHATVRAVCAKYGGYESGTEGDSFTLAFLGAADAVRFCVELQAQLLQCAWPGALQEVELCRPVWVAPATSRVPRVGVVQRKTTSMGQLIRGLRTAASSILTNKNAESPAAGTAGPLSSAGGFTLNGSSGTLHASSGHAGVPALYHRYAASAHNPGGSGQLLDQRTSAASAASGEVDVVAGSSHTSAITGGLPVAGPGGMILRAPSSQPLVSASALPHLPLHDRAAQRHSATCGELPANSAVHLDTQRPAGVEHLPLPPSTHPHERTSAPLSRAAAGDRHYEPGPSSIWGVGNSAGGWEAPSSRGSLRLGALTATASPAILRLSSSHAAPSPPWLELGMTVGSHLETSMVLVEGPGPGHKLLFRGLRVRCGVHTGITDSTSEVVYNRSAGRMQYTGAFAALAKQVQDAAQGGMVLLSEATKQHLHLDTREAIVVAHMGEHVLLEDGPPQHLYTACAEQLMHRFATLGPVRSRAQLSAGFLAAPYGDAAMVFMHVVGLASLAAYDMHLTRQCLDIFRQSAACELWQSGGYLVEETDAMMVTAFTSAPNALRWALHTLEACLHAEWPEELLEHELGEEIVIAGLRGSSTPARGNNDPTAEPADGRALPHTAAHSTHMLLFRGLRLKAGIDCGKVSAHVDPALCRMNYLGRVANVAARIAAMAKTGQVWASEKLWASAITSGTGMASNASIGDGSGAGGDFNSSFILARSGSSERAAGAPGGGVDTRHITATPLGPFQLRGIAKEVALVCCHFGSEGVLAGAGAALNPTPQAVTSTAEQLHRMAVARPPATGMAMLMHGADGAGGEQVQGGQAARGGAVPHPLLVTTGDPSSMATDNAVSPSAQAGPLGSGVDAEGSGAATGVGCDVAAATASVGSLCVAVMAGAAKSMPPTAHPGTGASSGHGTRSQSARHASDRGQSHSPTSTAARPGSGPGARVGIARPGSNSSGTGSNGALARFKAVSTLVSRMLSAVGADGATHLAGSNRAASTGHAVHAGVSDASPVTGRSTYGHGHKLPSVGGKVDKPLRPSSAPLVQQGSQGLSGSSGAGDGEEPETALWLRAV